MINDYAEFISHLTENARTSLYHANIIAQGYGSSYIGTEHLLLGILSQGSSVGAKFLLDAGVTLDRAQMALNMAPITVMVNAEAKVLSETAKLTLKSGWDIAKNHNQSMFGTEHILYSLLFQRNSRANVLLVDLGVDTDEMVVSLEAFLGSQRSETMGENDGINLKEPKRSTRSGGALDIFGTDLTEVAKTDKLDPVIGREKESERLAVILSRRTKNNPVLIGEPGVGKTAIVEGLAQKIADGNVPVRLLDSHIIQLDLAGMIAGTKYRGEFEDRLKRVISEAKKQKGIILFIDELHLLVGAGAAEGSIDAANILKPALARGDIHLIGATTLEEYRKHIEKDSALERRLQPIVVEEPSLDETTAILRGLKGKYEKFHGVEIGDEIIELVVNLSNRYINERFMPDKAIDLIDEAAALLNISHGVEPSESHRISQQIKLLNDKMEDAVLGEDYQQAAMYKTQINRLSDNLKNLRGGKNKQPLIMDEKHISKAISSMTGIPMQEVCRSEARLLCNLEKQLSKYVVGQDEAISKISAAIRRSRSGVADGRRPIGSLIFMGPTGVGKTELAKVLAREVFGSEKSLVKIDMSEFGEKHNVSRLLGAPAGYVGYDDSTQLTDKIRRQPYSVVLFDEIEKAHRDVLNLLLQILEDGSLTDTKGRKIDFTNTIVILTSNLGSQRMMKEADLGFRVKSESDEKKLETLHDENAGAALGELESIMKPELINRFDEIVTFRALTRPQVGKILNNLISELQQRLKNKNLTISLTSSAKNQLIKKGYSEKFGARQLRRVVQDEVENRIADGILSGKFKSGNTLNIKSKMGKIEIDVEKSQTN